MGHETALLSTTQQGYKQQNEDGSSHDPHNGISIPTSPAGVLVDVDLNVCLRVQQVGKEYERNGEEAALDVV
jgi:hypothetical protein